MGIAQKPPPVKLFLAAMYRDEAVLEEILGLFIRKFGTVEKKYGPLEVASYTNYYDREMGKGLKKYYMTFSQLIQRDDLPAIKMFTNELESNSLQDENRLVNFDPGYLSIDKLILASTKDFFHRIYLSQGIYAEVTLHYRKGRYRYFSWTYPDYKDKEVQRFLEKVRAPLVKELKNKR